MDLPTRARAAAIFGALGHSTRISVVELLRDQELSVGEISAKLDLPQSSASQHLAALLRAGILAVTPRGTSRLYRVRGPRITHILDLIGEFCEVHVLKGEPADEQVEL